MSWATPDRAEDKYRKRLVPMGIPIETADRERSGEVDHGPCGAGGRHRRLRLPVAPGDLLGAGYRRIDPGRQAAEGAEASADAGEWAAGVEGAAAGFRLPPVRMITVFALPSLLGVLFFGLRHLCRRGSPWTWRLGSGSWGLEPYEPAFRKNRLTAVRNLGRCEAVHTQSRGLFDILRNRHDPGRIPMRIGTLACAAAIAAVPASALELGLVTRLQARRRTAAGLKRPDAWPKE
jgi:hypothetical protein